MSSMNMMKRDIIAVLLTLIVSSCGKMPINGDLDGRWQIMKICIRRGRDAGAGLLQCCFAYNQSDEG